MTVITDAEIQRHTKRQALFVRRGQSPADAYGLAEKALMRDADWDDRRMCIECAHLQKDGACFAARQGWLPGPRHLTPEKTILQRCHRFEWQKP